GVAQVEHLVGHAGLDVDEVAGLVVDHPRQPRAILVAHSALEDVEHKLEPNVDVRVRNAAGGYCRHVHGEPGRADILRAHAHLVVDAVPAPAVAAAADHLNPVAPLDILLEVVVWTEHRCLLGVRRTSPLPRTINVLTLDDARRRRHSGHLPN